MAKLRLTMSCFWLCLARTVVSEELYHKVGGELVLKPDKSTVTDPITSILWKHGKNKVAEWDKDFGGLDIYDVFKERTSLNLTTGELRIRGLMKTDSGVYSVEFNGKLLDNTYKLSVIKAVPKPTITSSCNSNKTSCTLTCEGDTTDAEPVTYSWKVGEGAWEVLVKQLVVSKSDTGKPTNGYKYICKLNNAVSGEGEVSEPVGDVFGPEPSNIGAVVALVVFIIFVLVAITGMLVWKKKKGGLNLKVGGELLLKPDKSTVTGPITSILWKHGKNKVAEWEKDSGLYIYSPFHHRTTLYKTTGELKITRLKKTDSGVYSVEFNSIPLKKTYKLSVISTEASRSNSPKDEAKPEGGDDETKTVVSAEPGGDLNAAEKGEVKAEGSMLLNEDRVKYHNDNGEGAAEWNSVLKDVRELWTRGIQRIMKTREPTVSSGLPALDDKTF